MDRLGWIAVGIVLTGCPTRPPLGSGDTGSEGTDEEEGSGEPDTGGDPTTVSTSTSTTADPSLPSTAASTDPDGSATMLPETDGATDCLGGGGALPLGEPCVSASDCASGVCREFSDAPPDGDAYCDAAPDDCSTVITGTVWRLPPSPTGLPGVPVRIVKALEAITNPAGAVPLVELESDAAGRVDGVTEGPVSAAIAIIAITGGDAEHFLTATGVASEVSMGMYDVGTDVHDLWALPMGTLAAFNTALAADPSVPDALLPLGDLGGIVGVVRDAGGSPIPGAVVAPDMGGSSAIVRYVTDSGDVDDLATQTSGAFIILDAVSTGEDFTASVDGSPIASGTAGSANGVVFALVLTGV